MKPRKLTRLRQQIDGLRGRGGIKPKELERLARSLGRVRHKRGSEPNWVSTKFPDLRPVSIPHHGDQDLKRYTAQDILNQLELDIERFEALLNENGNGMEDDDV